MITIKISKLEKLLNRNIVRNTNIIAFDTASRTGWCRIKTSNTSIEIDYGFIEFKTDQLLRKYNCFVEFFDNMITKTFDRVIIEETYYSRNAKVFQFLSRLGGMIYSVARLKGIQPSFLSAVSARKNLGLKCIAKKAVVHNEFREKFQTDIIDIDVIDAIVLGINGILASEE